MGLTAEGASRRALTRCRSAASGRQSLKKNKKRVGFRGSAPPPPTPPQHLDIFKGAPLRLPKLLSGQFPVRVCSCPLCIYTVGEGFGSNLGLTSGKPLGLTRGGGRRRKEPQAEIGRLRGVGALWDCAPCVCGGGGGCAGRGVPLGAVLALSWCGEVSLGCILIITRSGALPFRRCVSVSSENRTDTKER